MAIAAFCVSVTALCVSILAAWYTRRQALATEAANTIAREQLDLDKRAHPPWVYSWEGAFLISLRNMTGGRANAVEISSRGNIILEPRGDLSAIEDRESVDVGVRRTGAGDAYLAVSWSDAKGDRQHFTLLI